MKPWLVINASPRTQGSCDRASELVGKGLKEGGLLVEHLALREFTVAPCVACGLCTSAPGACSLDEAFSQRLDHTAQLLERMKAADGLIFVSPVYFYSVPAQFKALIDRSQRFWSSPNLDATTLKPAHAVLLAGRAQGERLFEGTQLVLRPFLRLLGYTPCSNLYLRGLDKMGTISESPQTMDRVSQWTYQLVQAFH